MTKRLLVVPSLENSADFAKILSSALSMKTQEEILLSLDITEVDPKCLNDGNLVMICQLLVKRNCANVITQLPYMLRGKCHKLLLDELRKKLGEDYTLHGLRPNEIIGFPKIINKIVPPLPVPKNCIEKKINTCQRPSYNRIGPMQYGSKFKVKGPNHPYTNMKDSCSAGNMCYICHSQVACSSSKSKKVERSILRLQYPRLCLHCGKRNLRERLRKEDLEGRVVLVTGGRIKIGFQSSLKLLRGGARVITTTRFPCDAARRYSQELDFDKWKARLKIYYLDLQECKGIERLITYIHENYGYLDILINNAAQTICRPAEFYNIVLQSEKFQLLTDEQLNLVCSLNERSVIGKINDESQNVLSHNSTWFSQGCDLSAKSEPEVVVEQIANAETVQDRNLIGNHEISTNENILQQPVLPLNVPPSVSCSSSFTHGNSQLFPPGKKGNDGEQLDLRTTNSWTSALTDVNPMELLQVLTVNAVAPFVLCQKVKPLLESSPNHNRFIVNVSAMEGQFNRRSKTSFHPHTNMAKAALNMLTRTSGLEFATKNIFMTAVDTGWITDERPEEEAKAHQSHGFVLPLDEVDGACRVLQPIYDGITKPNPLFAVFLKDYHVHSW